MLYLACKTHQALKCGPFVYFESLCMFSNDPIEVEARTFSVVKLATNLQQLNKTLCIHRPLLTITALLGAIYYEIYFYYWMMGFISKTKKKKQNNGSVITSKDVEF